MATVIWTGTEVPFVTFVALGTEHVAARGAPVQAKETLPLNPAVKPLVVSLEELREINFRWKLVINESVEFDS